MTLRCAWCGRAASVLHSLEGRVVREVCGSRQGRVNRTILDKRAARAKLRSTPAGRAR